VRSTAGAGASPLLAAVPPKPRTYVLQWTRASDAGSHRDAAARRRPREPRPVHGLRRRRLAHGAALHPPLLGPRLRAPGPRPGSAQRPADRAVAARRPGRVSHPLPRARGGDGAQRLPPQRGCRSSASGRPWNGWTRTWACGTPWPATRLTTDGAEVLYDYAARVDPEGLGDLVTVRSGQCVFAPVVGESLRRITYADDHWAARLELPGYAGRARHREPGQGPRPAAAGGHRRPGRGRRGPLARGRVARRGGGPVRCGRAGGRGRDPGRHAALRRLTGRLTPGGRGA